MNAKLKIISPGFFSTIQDKGRFGFAKYGVPFSGAMDQYSFGFANALLNNNENDACIEWVFQPPTLFFYEPTLITLCGAQTTWFLNDKLVQGNKLIKVEKNDILRGSFCENKSYGYVGIRHGFLSPLSLGSRSFYSAITPQYLLKKGDEIMYQKVIAYTNNFSSVSLDTFNTFFLPLDAYPGPEYDLLSQEQKRMLSESVFTISGVANRMAIQLEELIPNTLPSMLTSPVLPGTIQLTPTGTLIVLMRDCQTTGGYPRILQLSESSINIIAQKRMKDSCEFRIQNFDAF